MTYLNRLFRAAFAVGIMLFLNSGYQPEKLIGLSVRFTAPVYPGDTIRTEMWHLGSSILFRSRAIERDIVVLNNGIATISPS